MKKITLLTAFLLLTILVSATSWIPLTSQVPEGAKVELLSSDGSTSLVKITLSGYYSSPVVSGNQGMVSVNVPNSSAILEKGAPDLRKVTTALMIPDKDAMDVSVVSSSFVDFSGKNVVPSKGNLYRDVDPASVPLTWGSVYQEDDFYPGKLASLSDPYIMRDYRGVSLNVFPFQYNPVTKTLRVYKEIIVKVKSRGVPGTNQLQRSAPLTKVDNDFDFVYKRRFLNYGSSKYTPVSEQGKMLIICYGSYMNAMQNFVIWKKTTGMPTEMVNVSTIGNTSTAIKNYIANYYNTNGLTFVLLVGDAAQVATYPSSFGDSDNSYGYITGSDHYPEVFVGRFSAESETDVLTQVNRTIQYEKTPNTTVNCYGKAVTIASDQGPGDDNEYDYTHQHNIRLDLLAYQYASGWELYDGTQTGTGWVDAAGNPTAADVTTCLNTGAGLISYTGHGADTYFVTTGFSNTNVNALNNVNMLPFIFSVACVNGNFVGQTCFAEAWMRARKGTTGEPIGAIATIMSTINQSWDPPMEGQDEMVDVLCEHYPANIKHKFGAITMSGCMKMNDTYPSLSSGGGAEMTDTWNIFGDPSLMVRTDTPKVMTVTHPPTILLGSTSMTVSCNVNGALVALTINHEIIGTGTVSGGQVTINFPALTNIDTITVCATAYNYIPYLGEVPIVTVAIPLDAGVSNVVQPLATYNCTNISVTPRVIIRNMGTSNLTSVVVNYQYDGGAVQQQNWTGNLATMQTDTVSLPAITLSTGSHTYYAFTSAPNAGTDGNTANDGFTRNFTVNNYAITSDFSADATTFCDAPATVSFTNLSANATAYSWDFGDGTNSTAANPTHTYNALGGFTVTLTASDATCGSDMEVKTQYIVVGADIPVVPDAYRCDPGTVTMTATATGTINWYDVATGGTPIATGTSFTTPFLNTSTTYYVQNEVQNPSQNAAMPTAGSGANYSQNSVRGLIFNSYQPFTLVSVEMNPSTTGSRNIQLLDSLGTVLAQTTVNFTTTGWQTVPLGFNVPVGYGLKLMGPTYANMWRDDAPSFPYITPGICNVYRSNSTTPTGYYYYFYNWVVDIADCISARIPATAYINPSVTAGFTYFANNLEVAFTSTAVPADSWNWDFGDGTNSTLENPVHTYAAPGSYNVTLTATNSCGSDSETQLITVLNVGVENLMGAQVQVFPNPAQNQVTIVTGMSAPVKTLLTDATGRVIYGSDIRYSARISLEGLSAGIYLLKLNDGKNVLIRKIIKE